MNGQQGKKQVKTNSRSQHACLRCRRSKIKCVNNDDGVTACQNCKAGNRECTYDDRTNGKTPAAKRSDLSSSRGDVESTKKRPRRQESDFRKSSLATLEDPLKHPVLDQKVWTELEEIFHNQYATELPFLHGNTFQAMTSEAKPQPKTRLFLLAFLTLTARFHSGLVELHARESPNPEKDTDYVKASSYYAEHFKRELGDSLDGISIPEIERVQALLMFGLFEWSQLRALKGWQTIGAAVRLAQAMRLDSLDDEQSEAKDVHPSFFEKAAKSRPRPKPKSMSPLDKEICRRTFWSAMILDRLLSGGKNRRRIIRGDEVITRLPCHEDDFYLVDDKEFEEPFLYPQRGEPGIMGSPMDKRPISGRDAEGRVLSKFIQLLEIWGRITEWSTAGGRRTERYPPWDERTQFSQMVQELKEFHKSLPDRLFFREKMLVYHISRRNHTKYASMNVLYSLCIISLHREYVPYIAIRCVNGPEGPLDAPIFPKEEYPPNPPDFWIQSAKQIFRGAADIMDIIQICQQKNCLPESALNTFALFTAAFSGIYALRYPNMDTEGLFKARSDNMHLESFDPSMGRTYIAITVLKSVQKRMKLARQYLKSLSKHLLIINLLDKSLRDEPNPSSSTIVNLQSLSIQQTSDRNGGLAEYTLIESELKDFGNLQDPDPSVDDQKESADSRASTADPGAVVKKEAHAEPPVVASFTPVNNARPQSQPDDRQHMPNSPYNFPSPVTNHHQPMVIDAPPAAVMTAPTYPAWAATDETYNGMGVNTWGGNIPETMEGKELEHLYRLCENHWPTEDILGFGGAMDTYGADLFNMNFFPINHATTTDYGQVAFGNR